MTPENVLVTIVSWLTDKKITKQKNKRLRAERQAAWQHRGPSTPPHRKPVFGRYRCGADGQVPTTVGAQKANGCGFGVGGSGGDGWRSNNWWR